jgi:hypothetical protein
MVGKGLLIELVVRVVTLKMNVRLVALVYLTTIVASQLR